MGEAHETVIVQRLAQGDEGFAAFTRAVNEHVRRTGVPEPEDAAPAPRPSPPARVVSSTSAPPAPGLYFLGLAWLHKLKSSVLCGVGLDAEYLAEHIARRA